MDADVVDGDFVVDLVILFDLDAHDLIEPFLFALELILDVVLGLLQFVLYEEFVFENLSLLNDAPVLSKHEIDHADLVERQKDVQLLRTQVHV